MGPQWYTGLWSVAIGSGRAHQGFLLMWHGGSGSKRAMDSLIEVRQPGGRKHAPRLSGEFMSNHTIPIDRRKQ
jgi:hypothetical protein